MKKALVIFAALAFAVGAHASVWTGAGGNWDSDINPGWNGTGVPNGIGAIANFGDIVTGTTIQNIVGGITVGTISLTNNSNNSRTITNTNGITMNQDGAGAGFATISNTNTDTGTANFLFISGGTLTLADDLLISNTGGSTTSSGGIQISSTISGTGNITFSNVSNTVTSSTIFPGAIRIQTGSNNFVGSVLVQKGAVTFNNANSFGGAGNTITLGQSGQGSATLESTSAFTTANPIVVAAGSGGTLVLGSVSVGASVYSGTVTLNGNLTYNSLSTNANGSTLSGVVSGVGSITKVGSGLMRLTNTLNSYQGGTFITAGGLTVIVDHGLGTGNVSLTASGVTLTLQGATSDYIADNVDLSIVTGSTVNLNFTGTDVVGSLTVDGVVQTPGVYGAGSFAELLGTGTLTVIPEPATYAILFVGAGCYSGLQRLRRKTS